MEYREFGKLDWKTSALGFGCMRFPTTDGNPLSGKIDEGEAIKLIRYAIDHGVNYIDTAYPYHEGESEIVVGKALKDGYRERVKLATKSPLWFVKKPEDFDKYLDEQLEKLNTTHIDFYLLHSLTRKLWNKVVLNHNILERAEEAKRKGKIKYIGFSFHDDYDCFEEIVDGYAKWDFCQIQYNYMDTENQAGTKGLKYAHSKGIPVVIMEPLLGGRLANPPRVVLDIFDEIDRGSSADWALQWLWNQREVSVVLSGMSSLDQLKENIESANKSGINKLTREELEIIERVKTKYRERLIIPCTGCNYCMPCPNNVKIPYIFQLYNDGHIHEDMEGSQGYYSRQISERGRANNCISCKICEEKCPQKIEISQWMPKVHRTLTEKTR